MKRLIYQVYLGAKNRLYDHCVKSVTDYCARHNIDHVVQREPRLKIRPDVFATNRSKESYEKHGGFLPIYEKENAFTYLKDYDQVAIIDADIFIKDSAPNIFNDLEPEYDFGAVVERDMPITPQYQQKIINYSNMQYSGLHGKVADFSPNNRGYEFMNMGLMVMNKSIMKYFRQGETPKDFIMRAEFKDFVDGKGAWKWSTDQTLLNTWIRKEKMNIKRMDWKWNALYKGVDDKELKYSNFIHFFLKDLLPERGENIEQLMKDIK